MEALLFINYGRPIVECSCKMAYVYQPGQHTRMCDGYGGCGRVLTILVPPNLPDLMEELAKRPFEKNRNWYPDGHPHGELHGVPTGQTVSDLATEFAYYSEHPEEGDS